MNNPLIEPHELPPFLSIRVEHMVPAISQLLAEIREGLEIILKKEPYSYHSVVKAQEELEDRLHQAWSPISHFN